MCAVPSGLRGDPSDRSLLGDCVQWGTPVWFNEGSVGNSERGDPSLKHCYIKGNEQGHCLSVFVLESTSGTPALDYSGGHTINSGIGRVLAVPHLFIHSFSFMHLFIHSLMHSFEYLLPTCQTGIYKHEYWLQKDTVKSKTRDMIQSQPERTCQPSEPWT